MAIFHPQLRWVLVVLLLSVSGGCMRPRPWRYVQEDAPWIGPGEQARTRYRHLDPPLFISAAGGDEYRWEDAKGGGDDQNVYIERATRYLVDSSETASWEERRNHHVNDELQVERIPPYHFTLVSIRPTIVLMRPLAAGAKPGRPSHNRNGGYGKFWPSALYWPGDIEYGTSFPYSDRLMWFSSDLGRTPAVVELASPNTAIIPFGSGELRLTASDGEWRVTRK